MNCSMNLLSHYKMLASTTCRSVSPFQTAVSVPFQNQFLHVCLCSRPLCWSARGKTEHGPVPRERPNSRPITRPDPQTQSPELHTPGGCGQGAWPWAWSHSIAPKCSSSGSSSSYRSGGGSSNWSSFSHQPSHPGLCGLSNLGQ